VLAAHTPASASAQTSARDRAGAAHRTAAGTEAPFPVPRLTGPITIDGRVDEPAWEAIEPLPAVMHLPTLGAEPTERTEFRIAYDDDAIYFSCRAFDSDPAGIQAPTLRRNAANMTNDWCVLQLDTFNDKETGLGFGTTPAGIRTDVVWANDGASGGNFSWNTFWDAAVHRDEHGWYAEIRIPLSSLRFQDEGGDGVVVMGVSAWRNIARKTEIITFPAMDNRFGGLSLVKASLYRDASFEGIRPTRPVYLTPYAMGAGGRRWTAATGGGFDRVDDRQLELGGDIKYALASNLTLDVTLNTDFAQAEADDQQVNLTRFSLFFPEKRLFFQERGETFAFPLGGQERLFHSRRIGLVGGEPVPILAGVRLVGRVGEWDVGLLDIQTGRTALGPSENLGAVRLRRRVLNRNSYIGGIATTRFAADDGGHNVLYGLDGILRAFGDDYLTINWAQSFHDDGDGDPGSLPAPGVAWHDRALARLFWERRGVDGPGYSLELARAGAAFEPGLGFVLRRDYTKAALAAGHGWRPGTASPVLRHGVRLAATAFARNDDGSLETGEIAATADVELRAGHTFSGGITLLHEDLRSGFSLADGVEVPAGEYRFPMVRVSYVAPNARLLRSNASVEAGRFYDGRIATVAVTPTWFASRHLELGGHYQLSRLDFPDRDQSMTAHLARLRAQVMVSARVLTAAFVQYSSATDRVSANVRFRYNPSEGHDLYLVWNEQLLAERALLEPVPPRSENRVLIIKYARTVTLGF
jgi:hypothetical protein